MSNSEVPSFQVIALEAFVDDDLVETLWDGSEGSCQGSSGKKKRVRSEEKSVPLGPHGGVYFNRRRNGRLVKHVVLPKILKHDIRRDYAAMFRNVYNSCDQKLMNQYLFQFCRPDSIFRQQCAQEMLAKGKRNLEVLGMKNISAFWRGSMESSPDLSFEVGVTNLRVRSDGTGVISFHFTLSGTSDIPVLDPSSAMLKLGHRDEIGPHGSSSVSTDISCYDSQDDDDVLNFLLEPTVDELTANDESSTSSRSMSGSSPSSIPCSDHSTSSDVSSSDLKISTESVAEFNTAMESLCELRMRGIEIPSTAKMFSLAYSVNGVASMHLDADSRRKNTFLLWWLRGETRCPVALNSLTSNKTWKHVLRYLEEKWKGVPSLSSRLEVVCLNGEGSLSASLLSSPSTAVGDSLRLAQHPSSSSSCSTSTEEVVLVQLFYTIRPALPLFALPPLQPLPRNNNNTAAAATMSEDSLWNALELVDHPLPSSSSSCAASKSHTTTANARSSSSSSSCGFWLPPGEMTQLALETSDTFLDRLHLLPSSSTTTTTSSSFANKKVELAKLSIFQNKEELELIAAQQEEEEEVGRVVDTVSPSPPPPPAIPRGSPVTVTNSISDEESLYQNDSYRHKRALPSPPPAATTSSPVTSPSAKRRRTLAEVVIEPSRRRIRPTFICPLDFKEHLLAFQDTLAAFAPPPPPPAATTTLSLSL
eukprot:scaffold6945_cov174-Ochromonas_danica.AAC.1